MSREVHVRFCERPGVEFLRPTHPYIPTWAGFLYLAVVLDVFSRRIVGWSMSTTLQAELVLAALDMALAVRKPGGVIHHSDQGSQGGFKWSSQHGVCWQIEASGQAFLRAFSSQASFEAGN